MRTNVTTNIVVTLVLSQEEAAWLHNYVQNDLTGSEVAYDAEMRRRFFEATDPKHNATNPLN